MDAERIAEWDERFARLQGVFRERIDRVVPKGDPLGFAEPSEWMIVRGFRDLAREANTARFDLLAEVARLTAERDELESLRKTDAAALRGVGAQVLRLKSELARLRAVIEEAREMHYKIESDDCGECCVVGWPCATVKVLDRGLKGAGDE